MNKPQSININNEIVYSAEEIYKYDPSFFIGVARVRLIIEKKKLKDSDFLFAYKKKDIWIISEIKYARAKLYLKEEYVIKNVPKMMDVVKQELYKYLEAPEILELEEHEKFKDKNDKTIKIEVRGERKHNECYFKVKDISDGFKMPNLNETVLRDISKYELNLHYQLFTVKKLDKNGNIKSKKCLFLTYNGILKVLFCSRTGNAESFQSWATEKLFTIQLGTVEQKEVLAADLIGVNHNTIKNVFNTNSSKTPCVYLYLIGKASDILEGSYDENDLLCKYGCTDDLQRRCSEHSKTYKKEFKKDIELLCFSIIEAQYIFNAESNISQYFKGNSIEYGNMKEVIIINKKDLPQIKQHYKMIQNSYIGRYEEMNNRIVILEKEIIELNNKILLKDKETEIMIEKHKNELKDKDIEILQIKLKFYEK